jgi:hypothetical protein
LKKFFSFFQYFSYPFFCFKFQCAFAF